MYDPFARGPHPVGVRSDFWADKYRRRDLPVEIWYPAAEVHRGEDLDPETQDTIVGDWTAEPMPQTAVRDGEPAAVRGPLVVFSHGLSGFRFEATFLTTHLASWGYLVVSADHRNSTFSDMEAFYASGGSEGPPRLETLLPKLVEDRRGDVPFLISTATDVLGVDGSSSGICGASLGGWTALMAPMVDDRIAASVPMCPAGGENPRRKRADDVLIKSLDLAHHAVPTLMLVGDRDSWLPLYGQLQIFKALASPVRMVVLESADHNHFVDGVEEGHEWLRTYTNELATRYPDERWAYVADSMMAIDELMQGELANELCRGAATAQFDAYLREDPKAQEFLPALEREFEHRQMAATVVGRNL